MTPHRGVLCHLPVALEATGPDADTQPEKTSAYTLDQSQALL